MFPAYHPDTSNCDNTYLSIDSLDDHATPKHRSSPNKRIHTRNPNQPLRMINVNCQSLLSQHGEWINLLGSTEPDIVVATETWLTSDVKDSELDWDGYTVYRRDRQNGLRGGVLIAVSNTIDFTEAFRSSESETLWVKVLL